MAFAAAGTGLLSANELVAVAAVAIVGGLLPDIDSNHSRPVRMLCAVAGCGAGLAVWASGRAMTSGHRLANFLSIQEKPSIEVVVAATKIVLTLAVALGLRTGLLWVVRRTTTHRGLIHSLPAAAVVGLGTTAVLTDVFEYRGNLAWIAGLALTAGFVLHLVLDECASVDLTGRRLKRSFGTAFKLGSRHNLLGTFALYLTAAWLIRLTPSPGVVLTRLGDPERWRDTFEALTALVRTSLVS